MAAASTYMASTSFSMLGWTSAKKSLSKRSGFLISAQQADVQEQVNQTETEADNMKQKQQAQAGTVKPRPVEPQLNVKSKNMGREYGGQWLSCTTRHVRIYAAYIDPETCEFDQTQMDKLTLILDPTDEFVWTDETCNKVYSYFQELVDHYEHGKTTCGIQLRWPTARCEKLKQSLEHQANSSNKQYNEFFTTYGSLEALGSQLPAKAFSMS
ncbi:NAD(P)H-quinone oxidoreductase subunit M, chloroplastic [Sesamum angolense]|uniref:NAD(P)H-quinone oxidoreductase subunit M, chloroplastic n=1 Tax=Sesamum angolense TaxID=2727404 RepID=A0AAE1W5V3_9LAMI|nr:NAD(P)H-quinone oxidoreductase subunit M, chloroplastic [Sesamum angolense]